MENIRLDYSPRMALVVKAKAPFIEWANALTEKGLFSVETYDPNVYLLPEQYKSIDQAEEALPLIFLPLFINELNEFADDAISQPRDKPYEMFCEWFDAKIVMHVHELNFDDE